MMEQVLLLYGDNVRSEKTKGFLELSGYDVGKQNMGDYVRLVEDREIDIKNALPRLGIVILEGENTFYNAKLCKILRKMTDKPIMILSEKGEDWEKTMLFQAGATDYMVSPYLRTELIARIRAHITNYRRLTHDMGIIKIRDLMIDVYERKVYVDKQLVPFRLKEFDILLFLVRNCNRVVTKEEIYRIIWKTGEFAQPYSNTVAVHIKRIREKIEKNLDSPQYLETVWGYGYRFLNTSLD
ncbi:MAG: winged helix-turn-helix domain-containing protein [Lachnospiraceae bacterium]